ncbi:MAG TPA: hypothetical protein VM163_00220 [bacterium]|nr:hypothetical protein [bacterium]
MPEARSKLDTIDSYTFGSILIDGRSFTADVKQYKEAAETLSHVVNAAVEVVVDAVHKNGGALIKFLGDAVFAVFDDVQVRRSNIPLGW